MFFYIFLSHSFTAFTTPAFNKAPGIFFPYLHIVESLKPGNCCRCISCCNVSVLPYSAAMLPASLLLVGSNVPGVFIYSSSDTAPIILWLLIDLLSLLVYRESLRYLKDLVEFLSQIKTTTCKLKR
jgi:hypothetical protein